MKRGDIITPQAYPEKFSTKTFTKGKISVMCLIFVMCLYPVAAANMYNYVYNGSSWVPALSTSDGQQKYWIEMANATYGSVAANLTVGENVGIGTTNPNQALTVVGNINITGDLYLNSSSIYLGSKKISVVGNELVFDNQNVTPAGMIAVFNGTCPTGWVEVNDTRGRYVLGTPESGTIGSVIGTVLTNSENREVGQHLHEDGSLAVGTDWTGSVATALSGGVTSASAGTPAGSITGAGTHLHDVGYQIAGRTDGATTTHFLGGTNWGSYSTATDGSHVHGFSGSVLAAHGHADTLALASGTVTGSLSSGTVAGSTDTNGTTAGTNAPYIQMTYCQKDVGSDYAEWIESSEFIEEGMIVSVDLKQDNKVIRTREEYDDGIVGVVSTQPGWLIGEESKTAVKLALVGQVPVKVVLSNGEIKRGDAITSSDFQGFGMKSTKNKKVIGISLTELNENSEGIYRCGENLCGEVQVLLGVSWKTENLEYEVGELRKDLDELKIKEELLSKFTHESVDELKKENNMLKQELCEKDESYSWC